ncbi:MAG: AAA family ATPase [bacterium]|nr:AAA family ATPase [bacterium]
MAMILVFFGMTASGKSTLAQVCAERYGAPYYNTDRVRKELAGLPATAHRPDAVGRGIYSHELSAKTYAALLHRATEALCKKSRTLVLLDGSYASLAERERVRNLARQLGVGLHFIYCWCSEEETRRRLQVRALDPLAVSDGRWEIYVHQVASFSRPLASETDVYPCNTEAAPEELLLQLIDTGILPSGSAT